MLKLPIKYTNFNDEEVTEDFYFHLTKTEIFTVFAEYEGEGGLEAFLRKMIRTTDYSTLVEEFKKIILTSYGEKSPDGRRFDKNDKIREDFRNSAAFDALFTMFLTDGDEFVAKFLDGIVPKDVAQAMKQADVQDKPTGKPSPPVVAPVPPTT